MRKKTEHASRRLGWLVAALAVTAVLSGAGFVREYFRSRQIDAEIRSLKDEAQRLQVRNFQVSSLEASLQNGEYLEREARLKLGLRKDGEQVVVLRKNDAPTTSQPSATLAQDPGWSNPRKWWTLFVDPKAYEIYVSSRRTADR
jgi:cell division protein FtsB